MDFKKLNMTFKKLDLAFRDDISTEIREKIENGPLNLKTEFNNLPPEFDKMKETWKVKEIIFKFCQEVIVVGTFYLAFLKTYSLIGLAVALLLLFQTFCLHASYLVAVYQYAIVPSVKGNFVFDSLPFKTLHLIFALVFYGTFWFLVFRTVETIALTL